MIIDDIHHEEKLVDDAQKELEKDEHDIGYHVTPTPYGDNLTTISGTSSTMLGGTYNKVHQVSNSRVNMANLPRYQTKIKSFTQDRNSVTNFGLLMLI